MRDREYVVFVFLIIFFHMFKAFYKFSLHMLLKASSPSWRLRGRERVRKRKLGEKNGKKRA